VPAPSDRPAVGAPDDLLSRAKALHQEGRLESAIELYGAVIERDSGCAEAHYKRANALNALGRPEAALEDYDRAISLDPSYVHALCNRGAVLERLGRREEALASYDRALALDADDPLTHYNRGSALRSLWRFDEALASYGTAIGLDGGFAEAHVNRGSLLQELWRHEEAVEHFGRAIELKPTIVEAFQGRGVSLCALKRFEQALADYEKVIALEPGRSFIDGMRCDAKVRICRWDGLDEDLARIAPAVNEKKSVCNPLTLATLLDSPALQRSAAETWVRDQVHGARETPAAGVRAGEAPLAPSPEPGSGKIRIAYFSADFRAHPVAYLTAGLFEHHDRNRFDVTAFALGPEADDPMRARLVAAFDRFLDVSRGSDAAAVAMARDLKIDIAIDLNGFTAYGRPGLFASRAAPIQVNFLGYPGTMGAPFMDYLIADGTVVPRARQACYAEKIVYLPDSFLPFDAGYRIADRRFTREILGLPEAGFVYCCFNNSHKILPETFDRWMRVLRRTDGVLWLQRTDATAARNLCNEASRRGVDARRLIFAERIASLPEHLARLRAADLFLDTFPYGAHATAMDALWAGVPLLTYPGESFASRVAASLLRTAGLPELIAASPQEYEELAVELAASPSRLRTLRSRLAEGAAPLFDTRRYARNLEAAYEAMYARHRSGAPPAHINEPSAS
jgi:protein O-GlcNAc transferase